MTQSVAGFSFRQCIEISLTVNFQEEDAHLNQSVYEMTMTFTKQELPVKRQSDECLHQRVKWHTQKYINIIGSKDLNKATWYIFTK